MSFELLHALALRRKADVSALTASTGLATAEIEAGLAPAVADGLAISARGSYVLAPKGATWLLERYPQAFAAQRDDTALITAYERFELVNRDLKLLITQWQTMTVGGKPVPNDHSDSAYDERILDRLASLHERAEQVIAAMATRLPRLARYIDRLAAALERAEGGEAEWVSGIRCDSYHTVWFEMHEDLLRLLGRKREE
jgi:hypothetical protein